MASSLEAQIQATCSALLDIALNTMVGATEVPVSSSRMREKNVNEMLQWRRHEIRLCTEVSNYKAASKRLLRQSEDINMYAENMDEVTPQLDEQLNRSIAKLQDELFERASKHQRDQLLIRRVIQAPMLLAGLGSKNQTDDSKYMKEAAKSRDQKVVQIMKCLQQLKAARSQSEQTKKKAADIHVQNCKLYMELQDKCEKVGHVRHYSDVGTPLQSELDVVMSRTLILRHVLRSIILESGVNWARRPELCNFMLQKGN